uniref:40S ribosomal protein S15 n=1 Tax=Moschus moschiferus TaxID=68415 RepID=A0A8C6DZQ7_MOSMO
MPASLQLPDSPVLPARLPRLYIAERGFSNWKASPARTLGAGAVGPGRAGNVDLGAPCEAGVFPGGLWGWAGSQTARCALARSEQLMQLYSARQRRRLNRGLRRKQHSLLKRLRKAKKDAPPMEKPEVVKTHLRDMIILPEMVGSMVGVYNGKTFNQVEIKPEMIGHYLGEFSITYKPVKHGRPGIGATHSSRFIPLK